MRSCLNNDGRTLRRHWSPSFPALHPFKYSSLQTQKRKIWESSSHTVVSSSIRDRARKQTHRGQCLTSRHTGAVSDHQIWHYLRFLRYPNPGSLFCDKNPVWVQGYQAPFPTCLPPVCLLEVCLMALHVTRSPRVSLSVAVHWNQYHTLNWRHQRSGMK